MGDLEEKKARLEFVEAVNSNLLDTWESSWKNKDLVQFRALTANNLRSSSWSDHVLVHSDHISEDFYFGNSDILDREHVLASIGSFLNKYKQIEDIDIIILRADKIKTILEGELSVRGLNSEGRKMQSNAVIFIDITPENQIEEIKLSRAKTIVAARNNLFVSQTTETGLSELPMYLRSEAIRRGGYALAIHDYNDDGFVDMYVGTAGPSILLRNNGNKFIDVTEQAGLEKDELVKAAVFADFNNDGNTDLMVVRFEFSPTKQIKVYEGKRDGTFVVAKNFNFTDFAHYQYNFPMPIGVGDFNGDQLLDFYVGFPGKLDFTTMNWEEKILEDTTKYKMTGLPQGLFINTGNFTFVDHTDYALYNYDGYKERLGFGSLFPHSAIATDLNNDGHTDIIVVDDRRNPSPIFQNNGDGTFTQRSEDMGVIRANWGMTSAVGDFDNDGFQDIYFTSVSFAPTFIEYNSDKEGNKLYRNLRNGSFEDMTKEFSLRFTGESPGGAVFFDFDNDGDLDLYVVNGLWSGPVNENLANLFTLAYMVDVISTGGNFTYNPNAKLVFNTLVSDGQAMMTLLKNYKTADGVPAFSLGGYQHNRLFKNNGDGTFTDISYISGVDSIADGYVVATADVNRDGALDLVLRNADPGTPNYQFETVQLFINNAGNEKNHITLRLTGSPSNKDAVGTKVTIWDSNGKKQYRELMANNGAAQDERIVHFGLGDDSFVQKIEVIWPSGYSQLFANVQAGDYILTEGKKLTFLNS